MGYLVPPYNVFEWDQYEKVRNACRRRSPKSNTILTDVITRDSGVLLGYEIAYRLKK